MVNLYKNASNPAVMSALIDNYWGQLLVFVYSQLLAQIISLGSSYRMDTSQILFSLNQIPHHNEKNIDIVDAILY